jgi:WD40 repeat protein
MVAAGCCNGTIHFMDAAAGQIKSSVNVVYGEVESVHWSPCGTKIAAACNDYVTDNYCVKILNSETGALLCALRGHTDPVRSVCFSPCGEKIASGGGDQYGNEDYSIRIWDAKTGEQIGSPLGGHSAVVNSVCFSSDGKKLTSGSEDSTVRNWDPATRASLS